MHTQKISCSYKHLDGAFDCTTRTTNTPKFDRTWLNVLQTKGIAHHRTVVANPFESSVFVYWTKHECSLSTIRVVYVDGIYNILRRVYDSTTRAGIRPWLLVK